MKIVAEFEECTMHCVKLCHFFPYRFHRGYNLLEMPISRCSSRNMSLKGSVIPRPCELQLGDSDVVQYRRTAVK